MRIMSADQQSRTIVWKRRLPSAAANRRFAIAAAVACSAVAWSSGAGRTETTPTYGSTADTVFDIIQTSDPSTFSCLEYSGRGERQIWDKRVDGEPVVNAFLFVAHYTDGTSIEIAINPEYKDREAARAEAQRFAFPLGQLPTLLRNGIQKFSVHQGDEGFHAGTGQVIVYSARADNRVSYDHLEESLFHESIHASLDDQHRLSDGWKEAQAKDGGFLTSYAQRSPEREDLAETALFAYAISHHPDRFPPVDTEDTLRAVPNRIEYIRKILAPDQAVFFDVGEAKPCGADAE